MYVFYQYFKPLVRGVSLLFVGMVFSMGTIFSVMADDFEPKVYSSCVNTDGTTCGPTITSKYSYVGNHYLDGIDHQVIYTAIFEGDDFKSGIATFTTPIKTDDVSIENYKANQNFNMGKDFGVCNELEVTAKSNNGHISERKAFFIIMSPFLPLSSSDFEKKDEENNFHYESKESIPLELLSDITSATVNEQIPIFGGFSATLKYIPKVDTEISSNGQAKMTLDFENMSLIEGEIAGREFKLKPELKIQGQFDSLPKCQWKWSGSSLGFSGSIDVFEKSFKLPFRIYRIPTYAKVKVNISGTGTIGIEEIEPIKLDGTIGISPSVRGSLGAGHSEMVGIEVWLNLGGEMGWKGPPIPLEQDIGKISGQVGLLAHALGFSLESGLFKCEWDFKSGGSCGFSTRRSRSFVDAKLLSRDYLSQSSYSRLRRSIIRGGEPAPIQTTVFPYSEANISTTGNNLYATWLSDNPDRSAVNRTMAIFSIWNGTEWSELQPIDDDGTADFHPKMLAFSDETAIATWEDTKQILADTAQFEDMVQNMEISVSNYESQKWSGTQRLTDNSYLDRSPKLSGKNNAAIVTWISNKTNNLLGDSANPNQLWYSQWLNNTWSTPQLVTEIPYPLIKYNTVYDGQNGYVVLSLDTDNDLQTIDDHELFTIALHNGVWDDSMNQLTTDTNVDDNPQLGIDSNGQFILTWLKGGEISSIVNFDISTKVILKTDESGYSSNLADFKLATSADGKLAMVWAEPSKENSSDLYAVFYDSVTNIWGNSKQLTSDQETEQRITASFYGSDTLIAIYNRKQIGEVTTESIESNTLAVVDSTDLYMVKYSIQTSDYVTVYSPFDYPIIKSVLSIENNGPVGESTAQFYGGVSVNEGNFALENNTIKKLNDTITVNGVIIPEAEHVGKKADIVVVGLYNSDPDYGKCEYEKDKGGYYMNRNGDNEYCNWIVKGEESEKVCNPNPTVRSRDIDSYWQDWNGNLNNLVPLYTMILSEQEILTADEGKVLYRDKPDYTGYVCLNLGYRVHDSTCGEEETNCCMQPDKNCPIVFNGETINFSVRE